MWSMLFPSRPKTAEIKNNLIEKAKGIIENLDTMQICSYLAKAKTSYIKQTYYGIPFDSLHRKQQLDDRLPAYNTFRLDNIKEKLIAIFQDIETGDDLLSFKYALASSILNVFANSNEEAKFIVECMQEALCENPVEMKIKSFQMGMTMSSSDSD